MKACLMVVGKTDDKYISEGITRYKGRLKHYLPFEFIEVADVKKNKNLSQNQQKDKEGKQLEAFLKPGDFIVLLDEKGKECSSREFATFMEKRMLSGVKRLVFIIGGPYGFSKEMYDLANSQISLSKMTFSHQLVRLVFFEQLYRAMTILKNEPYHHD